MTLDLRVLFAVALGGAAGSVARFLLSTWILKLSGEAQFPYGILAVNVAGSFLIAVVLALATAVPGMFSETMRLGIAVGVMGGFTTFSSFSIETVRLFQSGHHRVALLYILSSVVLCLLAAWLGWVLGIAIAPAHAGNP